MRLRYDMIQDYITVKGNIIFIMENLINIKSCAKLKSFTNKLNLNSNLYCVMNCNITDTCICKLTL